MNRADRHRRLTRLLVRGLVAAVVLASGPAARAQDEQTATPARRPITVRVPAGAGGTTAVAVTAILAIIGAGAALGARKKGNGAAGALRVVGRAQLTGRHAVYLLRAGERTLLIGVGPQGAPSLLGELEEQAITPPASRTPAVPSARRIIERSREEVTQCA